VTEPLPAILRSLA